MHAIASMVRALRARPGAFGLVGANGGFLSKYSAGVYSTQPAAWTDFDSKAIQAEIKAWAAPPVVETATGTAKIETYTIDYTGQAPRAVFIARTPEGQRLPALSDDAALVQALIDQDPIGGTINLATDDKGRNRAVGFTPA
jgi:acetyl-CoA C-acetyltransferase